MFNNKQDDTTIRKINQSFNLIENNVIIENKQDIGFTEIQKALKNKEDNIDKDSALKRKFVIKCAGFFKYTCNLCANPREKEAFNIFDLGRNYLTNKLDLTYYLKMIDQINSMKTILLKPYQIFMIDNQKKINLFLTKDRLHLDFHDNENLSSEN